MSWDIFGQDLPPAARTLADIPGTFQPQPIGSHASIVAKILETAPTAAFNDDLSQAEIKGRGYAIDVHVGPKDPCTGVAFFVYGSDPVAVEIIADILDCLGIRGLDGNTESGFFDRQESRKSFARWCGYRDQITQNIQ